jgi:hypothetical protein
LRSGKIKAEGKGKRISSKFNVKEMLIRVQRGGDKEKTKV